MISPLLTYLIHSGLAIGLFYLLYLLLLRKSTFFKLNRWMLLGQLFLAAILPFLPSPIEGIIASQSYEKVLTPFDLTSSNSANRYLSPENQSVSIPVSDTTTIEMEWTSLGILLYYVGVCFFLLRLGIQLYSLRRLKSRATFGGIEKGVKMYWSEPNTGPFSFMDSMFLPNSLKRSSKRDQIIEHESIHIRQKHSWDILIAELFIVFQWFNPFAWLYRRLIEANLEFFTDREMLKRGSDRKDYAYHLLSETYTNNQIQLSIKYNFSLIKQRIAMMHMTSSSTKSLWKYGIVAICIPLMMSFTSKEPQRKLNTFNLLASDSSDLHLIITENASREDLDVIKNELLTKEIRMDYSDVSYDDQERLNSMSINFTFASGGTGISYDGAPFTPIYVVFYKDGGSMWNIVNENLYKDIISSVGKITLLTAGVGDTKKELKRYLPRLKEIMAFQDSLGKEELIENSWEAKSKGTATYTKFDQATIGYIKDRVEEYDPLMVQFVVKNNSQLEIDSMDALEKHMDRLSEVVLKTKEMFQVDKKTFEPISGTREKSELVVEIYLKD